MLVAIQREAGGEVTIEERPDPGNPAADQVFVAMRRMPINPADLLLIDGSYGFSPSYPQVIGAEGVGEVLAVGDDVGDFAPGDHVLPLTRGNWASHRLIARKDLVRVPMELPLDSAAVLRINPATAWRMLASVPVTPAEWLIQNGAGSMVAHWVRRLARDQGRSVIDVVRRLGQPAGSDHVLVDDEDLTRKARDIVGRECLSLALDCVAGDATGRLAETLDPGGTLIVFGHLSGYPISIRSAVLTSRQLNIRGFSLRPAEEGATLSSLQALFDTLATLAGEPEMAPAIAASYPLRAIGEALEHARRPGAGGRILLAADR